MEPIFVAGVLLVPSTVVFLAGCALALVRTVREVSSPRRMRQLPSQHAR